MLCKLSLKSSRYMQYISTINVTLLSVTVATYLSWGSPTLPLLTSENSPIGIRLTNEEASWVVSSFALGVIPGSILVGVFLHYLGPKKTLLVASILFVVSWIIIGFSRSTAMLIIARIIGGFGGAIQFSVMPMYIGEIASKDIRGRLSTIPNFGGIAGAITVLSGGPFVSFTTLTIICAIFPLLFGLTFVFMPESPYFLLKQGKKDAARKNLIRLSSATTDDDAIEVSLNEIEQIVENDNKANLTMAQLIVSRNCRKSLLIMLGVKTLSEFSGSYVINSYFQTIMESSQSSLSPEIASVVFSVVQIPAVTLCLVLMDKIGRRPLLIISSVGSTVALASEGVYFYLQDKVNLDGLGFLPILCLVLFKVMVSIGLAYLPYTLVGELFATNTKKVGGIAFACYAGVLNFINLKLFNTISDATGIYAVFWLFAAVSVLGIFFGLFILPETKGKSFDEIQNDLNFRKSISYNTPKK